MSRLVFFPEGYPDEDFRSILFRYHIRSGNTSIKQTSKELFGTKNTFFAHLPRMMKNFINNLPIGHGYSSEFFLKKHTFLPFFRPFVTKERFEFYWEDIVEGTLTGNQRASYITVTKGYPILSDKIRYCSECMKEDNKVYGECYVHLMHQIEFLNFCPVHKTRLITSCSICGEIFSKSSMLCSPLCSNNHNITSEPKEVPETELKLKLNLFLNMKQIIMNSHRLSTSYICDRQVKLNTFR